MPRSIGGLDRWTEAEDEILKANLETPLSRLAPLIPGRTPNAIQQRQHRFRHADAREEKPPVKEAGEYIETLSAYFIDQPGCLDIWLKWNGYFTCRELCRDMKATPLGIVTLLCEAK